MIVHFSEYALERIEELEKALLANEMEINKKDKSIKELQYKIVDQENLHEKQQKLEATLQTTDMNLRKAYTCIQGFVQENQSLMQKLEQGGSNSETVNKRALVQQGIFFFIIFTLCVLWPSCAQNQLTGRIAISY